LAAEIILRLGHHTSPYSDLDEEDLIALVNIFTADVSATDTYMEL
jgi:hypothetical protein